MITKPLLMAAIALALLALAALDVAAQSVGGMGGIINLNIVAAGGGGGACTNGSTDLSTTCGVLTFTSMGML